MARFLVMLGLTLVALGLLWPWLRELPLGRLPGDIVVRRPQFQFYFPVTTCILISLIGSLILWLLRK